MKASCACVAHASHHVSPLQVQLHAKHEVAHALAKPFSRAHVSARDEARGAGSTDEALAVRERYGTHATLSAQRANGLGACGLGNADVETAAAAPNVAHSGGTESKAEATHANASADASSFSALPSIARRQSSCRAADSGVYNVPLPCPAVESKGEFSYP
eukprot:4355288-Pleurochrysis_carterae.AAC.1